MNISHDIVSNAFRLAVALAFVPAILSIGRNIRIGEARKAFIVGILAIIASFAMTAVDQQLGAYLGPLDLVFRWVRHLTVALGGFAFAWAAWKAGLHEASSGGHR